MVDAGLGKFDNFSWYYYITYSDFKATNFSLKFLTRIRIEHDMYRVKISRTLENIFLAHRKKSNFLSDEHPLRADSKTPACDWHYYNFWIHSKAKGLKI